MADNKNNEVSTASAAAAPVETVAPVVVEREARHGVAPVITALAVALALIVGGIGGFAIARATGPGGARQTMEQGQLPGGPGGQQGQGQQGQQGGQGQQDGPGGQQGHPPRPGDDEDAPSEAPSDDSGDTEN